MQRASGLADWDAAALPDDKLAGAALPRLLSTLLVVALLGGTAAAFAVTQGLKIEPSPILAPRIDKVFSPVCDCATRGRGDPVQAAQARPRAARDRPRRRPGRPDARRAAGASAGAGSRTSGTDATTRGGSFRRASTSPVSTWPTSTGRSTSRTRCGSTPRRRGSRSSRSRRASSPRTATVVATGSSSRTGPASRRTGSCSSTARASSSPGGSSQRSRLAWNGRVGGKGLAPGSAPAAARRARTAPGTCPRRGSRSTSSSGTSRCRATGSSGKAGTRFGVRVSADAPVHWRLGRGRERRSPASSSSARRQARARIADRERRRPPGSRRRDRWAQVMSSSPASAGRSPRSASACSSPAPAASCGSAGSPAGRSGRRFLALYLAPSGHTTVYAAAAVVGVLGAFAVGAVFRRWPWLVAVSALACARPGSPFTSAPRRRTCSFRSTPSSPARRRCSRWELAARRDALARARPGGLPLAATRRLDRAQPRVDRGPATRARSSLLFFWLPFGLLGALARAAGLEPPLADAPLRPARR